MNILAIKARRDVARMLAGGVMPYSTGSGIDPEREFRDHAAQDIDDLLAVLEPIVPYLHQEMPTETLVEVMQMIRENHERVPFITDDWAREREDREFYQGLLGECAQVLRPLAEQDPALRELAGRLQVVLADHDEEEEPF